MLQKGLSLLEEITHEADGSQVARTLYVHWIWYQQKRKLSGDEVSLLLGREAEIVDNHIKYTTNLNFTRKSYAHHPIIVSDIGVGCERLVRPAVPPLCKHLALIWQHARFDNNLGVAECIWCTHAHRFPVPRDTGFVCALCLGTWHSACADEAYEKLGVEAKLAAAAGKLGFAQAAMESCRAKLPSKSTEFRALDVQPLLSAAKCAFCNIVTRDTDQDDVPQPSGVPTA